MGKKSFFNKKNTVSYNLVPSSSAPEEPKQVSFKVTGDQLEEQHKYGIFFDDDYDYMKHLRSRDETYSMKIESKEDVKTDVIKVPSMPMENFSFRAERSLHETQKGVRDDDVDRLLEGNFKGNQDLEDDFITLAGGVAGVLNPLSSFRPRTSDDEESEEDDYDAFDDELDEDEQEEEEDMETRTGPQRDIDDAFDRMLEADYHEDQLGELDGDDELVAGMLEPDSGRLRRLAKEKIEDPDYDEQLAKDYVKKRFALIEAGVIKEDSEMVEVEESPSKKLKWDCESFASQYSNLYNHPTVIKDPNQVLSRKALKRFNRANEKKEAELEEEDEEMDMDDDDNLSQCTSVSTIRPKGETPEERNLRKKAVKAARRARIVERKQNQAAFADAHRKMAQSRFGQVKFRPVA
ncbi:unnamed protein product [Auanema sp. JU1783]|nr:unnamed protein product [Auanema sp. JU1783]